MAIPDLDFASVGLRTDALYDEDDELQPKYALIGASNSGNNEIVAAVSGKKIRVLSYSFVCSDAVNVKWRSANTDKTGLYYCAANGGISEAFCPVGLFETAAGEALNLNLSGVVPVGGRLTYIEVE